MIARTASGHSACMHETSAALGSTSNQDEPVALAPSEVRLRVLFDEHFDAVWRFVRRLGVREDEVDDAVQQAFVVTSQRLSSLAPGTERSFLFGTALRVASQARRTERRRRLSDVDPQKGVDTIDPAPNPEETTALLHARELADEVLRNMPIDLRAVFVLFEADEMSMPQIAVTLGIPVGTVASRLRRAREHFETQVKRLQSRSTLRVLP